MTSPTTELRLRLLAVGIPPLPSTVTKEVFLPEWRRAPIDETEKSSRGTDAKDWPNTSGRLTNHPCLDIDILDEEAASAVEQHVRARFDGRGIMLLRTGRAPKRLIPFRTDTPFDKRLLCYVAPNGMPHRVEFLVRGQQAVFYGMHETGKPYHWHADRDPIKVPPSEWVRITEAEADQLLAEIDELLVEQFGYTRTAAPNPDGSPRSSARVTDVDAAFQSLHYAGEGGGGNIHDTELGCINALIVQRHLRRGRGRRGAGRSPRLCRHQPAVRRMGLGEGAPPPRGDGLQLHQQVSRLRRPAAPRPVRSAPGPPGPGRPRSPARVRPGAQALALPRAAARRAARHCHRDGGNRRRRRDRNSASCRSVSCARATTPATSSTS